MASAIFRGAWGLLALSLLTQGCSVPMGQPTHDGDAFEALSRLTTGR